MDYDSRNFTKTDSFIINLNKFIDVINPKNKKHQRENPAKQVESNDLTNHEILKSTQMMRVNHSGEVAAQALYLGQAITAKSQEKRDFLLQSAIEEKDHLIWCKERLEELNSNSSFLNPVWFVGSIFIGAIAGISGDKWSMGFLAETEFQVTSHIDNHLQKISSKDKRSISILNQMRIDELNHATNAIKNGAEELPIAVKSMMKYIAKIMTFTAKYI